MCNQSLWLQILPHCQLALAFQSSFNQEVVLNSQRRNMESMKDHSELSGVNSIPGFIMMYHFMLLFVTCV